MRLDTTGVSDGSSVEPELFRSAFDLAAIGLVFSDLHNGGESSIRMANATAGRMLSYSESELRALKFDELLHSEDKAAAAREFAATTS